MDSLLTEFYRRTLVDDVLPFWIRHGWDREHGGMMTCLAWDGSIIDSDKSIWFQGRAAWMYATAYLTVERNSQWLEVAGSCVDFLRRHGADPSGKLYFIVDRQGKPVRMRRYVWSEAFAAIAYAAYSEAGGEGGAGEEALRAFGRFVEYNTTPGRIAPKDDPGTRPSQSIGYRMGGIHTAGVLRQHLGNLTVRQRTLNQWIDAWTEEVRRLFYKPEIGALMEIVSPDGSIIDHHDGRMLNPGHALEMAWFLMDDGMRRGLRGSIDLGLSILDCMWQRGWDTEHGGLFYFRDVYDKPVQEYWHDMKFWWPHNEAIIATLLAWKLTGEARYARMHREVHDWSFAHFADAEQGEWYGYLHRDGTPSTQAKGTLWKGPFHLPRMLWYCQALLRGELASEALPAGVAARE